MGFEIYPLKYQIVHLSNNCGKQLQDGNNPVLIAIVLLIFSMSQQTVQQGRKRRIYNHDIDHDFTSDNWSDPEQIKHSTWISVEPYTKDENPIGRDMER